jgi:undecaprenyl-diphosphatase
LCVQLMQADAAGYMEFIWQILSAIVLAVIEGVTEFLPVSATGHMILAESLLGLKTSPSKVFEISIQFGAILSLCVAYYDQLWQIVRGLPRNANAQRFALGLVIAFLPAAALGVLLSDWITEYFFSPYVVSIAMVIGGVIILAIERALKVPRYYAIEDFPLSLFLKIGLCQCLALVPGISRSGATIIGSLFMGVERSAAAEFSFVLAIPTLLGATVYSLYKNWGSLNVSDFFLVSLGFAIAFISAYWVVRRFVVFVSRNGFGIFAWYRIVAGSFLLGWFTVHGR